MGIIDTYIPMDRRTALARGEQLADRTEGAVLFADISGFTRFSDALNQELGAQRGAEILTQHLNRVYENLIREVHRYGGSVISLEGDAVTCWFDNDKGRLATAAALDMQKVMTQLEVLTTPNGQTYSLGIKVAVTSGKARRFLVGQPRIDVLAGEILTRMAAAEGQVKSGEVVVGAEVMRWLGDQVVVQEWRQDESGEYFAVVTGLKEPIPDKPWVTPPPLDRNLAEDWLLEPVYTRLMRGEGDFLAELRRVVAIFINFHGVDYDQDEEAGHKLDAFIRWVQKILKSYGGFLLHFSIGDKGSYIYSEFGAPISHENDVDRALAASLELVSPPNELSYITDIRIGISYGEVRVGAYGATSRRTYSAHGLDVNLAARLMSLADPGQIFTSQRIAEKASRQFRFKELEPVKIRGFDKPFSTYILGTKRDPRGPDVHRQKVYPLIGREAEKSVIEQGLKALLNDRGATIVIEGEAGIGKTQLVEYAVAQASQAGVEVWLGAGDEMRLNSLYYAWRPIFSRLFKLEPSSEESQKFDRQRRRRIIAQGFEEFAPDMIHLAPLLNEILLSDFPENDLTSQMAGEVRADNIRLVLFELLSRVTHSSPTMLVLEDAHWMDSGSWALTQMVQQDIQPILLVIVHRPLRDPVPSEYGKLIEAINGNKIKLDLLRPKDVEALICQRLDVNHIPPPVLDLVYKRSEGNPLFSIELAYELNEKGIVKVSGDELQITSKSERLEQLNIPETSQEVIQSRIDRLDPGEQLTLKVASVIGRVFVYSILQDIYPQTTRPVEGSNLVEHLDNLERVDLTEFVSRDPDLAYRFKHILFQEVAYNLMLFTTRNELHRAIANWYEKSYEDNLAQVYPLLAYHWYHTEDSSKAAEYLEKSAIQAMRSFANREVVNYLRQAFALLEKPGFKIDNERRAQWALLLGEAYVNLADYIGQDYIEDGLSLLGKPIPQGKPSQYLGVLRQVLAQVRNRMLPRFFIGRHADQREKLLAASRACERLVEVYFFMNEIALSLYASFRTLNIAEEAGISPELARGYATVGALIGFIPLHRLARSYLQRALDTIEGLDDLNARIWILTVVAFYYNGVGQWSTSIPLLKEGLEISKRLGAQRREEDFLGNLFAASYFQGDFAACLKYTDKLIPIARQRNAYNSLAYGLQGKAYASLHMGDPDAALICLEELRSLLGEGSKVTDEALILEMHGLFALTYMRRFETELAIAEVERLLDLSAKATPSNYSAHTGYIAPAYTYLSLWESGQILPAIDKLAWNACKNLRKYVRVFPIGEPRALLYEGLHHWLSGKQDKAYQTWEKSLAVAEELNMRYDKGLAHLEIGRHLPLEDSNRRKHLDSAIDLFADMGAEYDLTRAEAALSEI